MLNICLVAIMIEEISGPKVLIVWYMKNCPRAPDMHNISNEYSAIVSWLRKKTIASFISPELVIEMKMNNALQKLIPIINCIFDTLCFFLADHHDFHPVYAWLQVLRKALEDVLDEDGAGHVVVHWCITTLKHLFVHRVIIFLTMLVCHKSEVLTNFNWDTEELGF